MAKFKLICGRSADVSKLARFETPAIVGWVIRFVMPDDDTISVDFRGDGL